MHAFIAAVFYLGVSHLAAPLSLLLFSKKNPKTAVCYKYGKMHVSGQTLFRLGSCGFQCHHEKLRAEAVCERVHGDEAGCRVSDPVGEHLW